MFFRILKNDLSRRKVTNAILLLFIALAAMLVSGSVNNIVTIVTAQDSFYDKAGMMDVFAIMRESEPNKAIISTAKSNGSDEYVREPLIFVSRDQIDCPAAEPENIVSIVALTRLEGSATRYFTADDEPLGEVGEGGLYIPRKAADSGSFSVGDEVKITVGNRSVNLTVKGIIKDALLGSQFVGGNRFVMSGADFDRLINADGAEPYMGALYSFSSSEPAELVNALSATGETFLVIATRSQLKMANIMDIIIAAMFLAVSVCLLLISFVVLNFTIKFTLGQEFREIGVMKAIGLPDSRTESVYMAKYLFISALGAAIGFAAGIPFGNFMLKNAEVNIVIENGNPYGVNLACALLVMLAVMLFCRRCVRSVRKYTPVDAVRSGNNGETYSRKSPLPLEKTALRPVSFLAVNDILTNVKTFAVMAFTFTLSLMMMIVVVDTINTLRSGKIVTMMSMAPADLYLSKTDDSMDFMNSGGRETAFGLIGDAERKLEENGVNARVFMEVNLHSSLSKGDRVCTAYTYQGIGTTTGMYSYLDGTAPRNAGEIAVTNAVAQALDADIGDTVTLATAEGEKRVMITAVFQSMMNMGNGVRIHEDYDLDFAQLTGTLAPQIRFDDSPDGAEFERRTELVRELFPDYEVLDGGEYIDKLINVASILEKVRMVLIPLLLIVCMLVTVLMERSLIARELSETAMLKAAGFSDGFVIRRDMLRVTFTALLSTLIALPLSTPFAQVTGGIGFRIMGADSVIFDVRPLEVFLIYPLILLSATLFAVLLTAQSTRRITANQTAGIE